MDDVFKYLIINLPNDAVLTLAKNAYSLGLINSIQSLTQCEKRKTEVEYSFKMLYDNTYVFDTVNRQLKYVITGNLAPGFYSNMVFKISSAPLLLNLRLRFGEGNRSIYFTNGKVYDGYNNLISNWNIFAGMGTFVGLNLGYKDGILYLQKYTSPDNPFYQEIVQFNASLSDIYFDISVDSSVNGDFIIRSSNEADISPEFLDIFQ